MHFELNEEHLAVREAAREFAQKELKPGVIERDRNMSFPTEEVQKMAELGFLGMMVDPQYGGGGMDTLDDGPGKVCRRLTMRTISATKFR